MFVLTVDIKPSVERMDNMKPNTFRCCICGQDFTGFGNNPWPVVKDEDARCCDVCNETKVIPARILQIMEKDYGTEQGK